MPSSEIFNTVSTNAKTLPLNAALRVDLKGYTLFQKLKSFKFAAASEAW